MGMANVVIQHELEALESEEKTVLLWRHEQFSRLGFDLVDSRLLAESSADLGQARSLCRAGCPLDLAFRILA
jgi:hypothetical protein